jgi:hypothetical protein
MLSISFAEREGGAVSFEDLVNQQIALQKGDCLICLDPEGYSKMKFVERLNPSKEIRVLNVEETCKVIEEKNKFQYLYLFYIYHRLKAMKMKSETKMK